MPETYLEEKKKKKKVVMKLFSFLILCVCVRACVWRTETGSANSALWIGRSKVNNVSI